MPLNEFSLQAVSDFKQTAAIRPSSRFLVDAMLEPLPVSEAQYVVELGPGTGVFTRQLLKRMSKDSKLLAFEINPKFTDYLSRNFSDSRLEILNSCAGSVGDELIRRRWSRVDVVVTSLGFGLMSNEKIHEIFTGLMPFMDRNSMLSLFQYVHQMKYLDGRISRFDVSTLLSKYFRHIDRRTVLRNLPPAFIFTCRV